MTRSRARGLVLACLMLAAFAPSASAATTFHPRVANALGLVPPAGGSFSPDVASGALTPLTYHGGSVMNHGVHVHVIFWDGGGSAAGGRDFQASPAAGVLSYQAMVEQFFTDVAHDSGTTNSTTHNVFSVLAQFASGLTPATVTAGLYNISFNAGTDVIMDHNPYPALSAQCASPQNASICITDGQLQKEIDNIITSHGGSRGLGNFWYVFTPPDVDECITAGVCESNAFGGYHSVSDLGHGTTIYAFTGDPSVETSNVYERGKDPQGNPVAELTVDIAAHETVEAMTDPEGVGYMDPNGFETGDKCEFGPQHGQTLGFSGPDNAPFNNVIHGHNYYIQEMWANHDNNGHPNCVQNTTTTTSDLPLAQVHMTQYSGTITGNTENAHGNGVSVAVKRSAADGTAVTVATGSATAAANGNWTVHLNNGHVVGDDRDQIVVTYTGTGAPKTDTIQTGNGGNPFTESGWTGWFDLDNGTALSHVHNVLQIAPCFQTGVESATLNGAPLTPPHGDTYLTDFCNTQTDVSTVRTPVGAHSTGTVTTLDDRAFVAPGATNTNTVGALVSLTVTTGEPDSVSAFVSPLAFFTPTGFPSCTGDLEAQTVTCTGLVPGSMYSFTDGSKTVSHVAADATGTASTPLKIKGGDSVALKNSSAQTLTTLHVAHLKVKITASQLTLDPGSTCQPGQYYGAPVTTPPTNASAGAPGVALTGAICPTNGSAAGLANATIAQTDERSGGVTQTEVPAVQDTSPLEGEIVYGTFTAVAETGLPGTNNTVISTDSTSKVALSITRASGGKTVFKSTNVDTVNGVKVSGLKPGTYKATWTLSDANGDTRTITTRFVEEPGTQGPPGPRGKPGPAGPTPIVTCVLKKHHRIKCKVSFKRGHKTVDVKGTVRMRIGRGGHVAALGHGQVRNGHATLTLRELRQLSSGSWTLTIVFVQAGHGSSTTRGVLNIS